MVDERLFEQGRKELEAFLNREVSATEDERGRTIQTWYDEIASGDLIIGVPIEEITTQLLREWLQDDRRLIYVRAGSSDIVGRGTHQIAIDLGNGLVAKVNYKGDDDSNIVVIGRPPCQFMRETRNTLIGLGTDVPEMQFYRVDWNGDKIIVSADVTYASWGEMERRGRFVPIEQWPEKKGSKRERKLANIYLTPDLREGGKYTVVEYNEEQARKLPNGASIVNDFQDEFSVLLGMYRNFEQDEQMDRGKPFLMYEPHKLKTAEEAISKMFLLQVPVDKKKEGRLVVGDIDHVYIFK